MLVIFPIIPLDRNDPEKHDKNKYVKLAVAFNRMIFKICFENFSENFLNWHKKASHMTLILFLF